MILVERQTYDQIAPHIAQAMDGEEAYYADEMARGDMVGFRYVVPGVGDGYACFRIEGSTFVICAFEGAVGVLEKVAPLMYQSAKNQQCDTIRFHTRHPGLGRLVNKIGWSASLSEAIYTIPVGV